MQADHMPAGYPSPADLVRAYFDALYLCDTTLLDRVFHPRASLFDADGGDIVTDPIGDYRAVISERVSPASVDQPRTDEAILRIDGAGDRLAVAAVRLRIHDKIFFDHLSLAKGNGGWKIVAKTWMLERTLADAEYVPAGAGY